MVVECHSLSKTASLPEAKQDFFRSDLFPFNFFFFLLLCGSGGEKKKTKFKHEMRLHIIPVGDHTEYLTHSVKAVRLVLVTYYIYFVCIQNTQHTNLMRIKHPNQLQASLSYAGLSKLATSTGSHPTPLAKLLWWLFSSPSQLGFKHRWTILKDEQPSTCILC